MALKTFKPNTPGQRTLVIVDRSGLYKGKPVKKLTEGLTSKGGRNNQGRVTARRRGGGVLWQQEAGDCLDHHSVSDTGGHGGAGALDEVPQVEILQPGVALAEHGLVAHQLQLAADVAQADEGHGAERAQKQHPARHAVGLGLDGVDAEAAVFVGHVGEGFGVLTYLVALPS